MNLETGRGKGGMNRPNTRATGAATTNSDVPGARASQAAQSDSPQATYTPTTPDWGPQEDWRPTKTYRRIAVEEAFRIPEVDAAISEYLRNHADEEPGMVSRRDFAKPAPRSRYAEKILDLGAGRVAEMDKYGIEMQVLSLGTPGVQLFERDQAIELSRLSNDRLAEAVRAHPTRFAGLACVAPQAPDQAAQELERCVRTLGFKGVLINSHTKGRYLDEPEFWPLLEAVEALNVPLYIHPRSLSNEMLPIYAPRFLDGPAWGYAADVGLHALRLMYAGVFRQFPGLRVVIGHMGENVPYNLERLDRRYKQEMQGTPWDKMQMPPSECFRQHFYITTSAVNWAPALRLCLDVLGSDRVLFADDYPYEFTEINVRNIDMAPISEEERERLYHLNARQVFNLDA